MSNTSPHFRFFDPEKRDLHSPVPGSSENGTSDPVENNGVVIPMPRRKFSVDPADSPSSPPPANPAMMVSARTVYVPTAELPSLIEEWIDSSIGGARSERMLQERVGMMSRFLWFLHREDEARCGLAQLRKFFVHLETGHQKPEGRWGQGEAYGGRKPMRPVSQATYYRHLRAFFYWLVAEEVIPLSPMSRIEQPNARTDQPEHFTPEQIDALLKAAKRTRYPLRDTALIWFLLDTGVRASECCSINLGDLDLIGGRAQVTGKGDKKRTVCFRSTTRRALRAYINTLPQAMGKPLFASESGQYVGERLTRAGLGTIIRRLGKAARLTGVRCSPHTFRHTYTFMMLNSGAPIQSVQESLGHTDPKMTLRYSKFAHADVASQHRRHSPAEQIAAKLRKS